MEVKYVAQGLLRTWKEDENYRLKHNPDQPKTPLMYFLEYNYKERYVKLCQRLGVNPVGFGAWLRKPIESII
jgi:hypothetical protein